MPVSLEFELSAGGSPAAALGNTFGAGGSGHSLVCGM
jgi:hypothetical protein